MPDLMEVEELVEWEKQRKGRYIQLCQYYRIG